MSEIAPIIVSAVFAAPDQAWLDGLRQAHFPPERNHLAAHLTLFHHLPPSLAPELARRLGEAAGGSPPPVRVSGVMNLGRGTALRIESPALAEIRSALAAAFAGLLTPQDQAGWRPHVTIQNKVEPHRARLLQQQFATMALRPLHLAALATWYYRGGPWEPIARYPFRG